MFLTRNKRINILKKLEKQSKINEELLSNEERELLDALMERSRGRESFSFQRDIYLTKIDLIQEKLEGDYA